LDGHGSFLLGLGWLDRGVEKSDFFKKSDFWRG
jgi:hypothetical protein